MKWLVRTTDIGTVSLIVYDVPASDAIQIVRLVHERLSPEMRFDVDNVLRFTTATTTVTHGWYDTKAATLYLSLSECDAKKAEKMMHALMYRLSLMRKGFVE